MSSSEGDITYKKRHRCYVYTYAETKAGFAERNLPVYHTRDTLPNHGDRVALQLAWSRTLGCLRRAFGVGSNWAVLGNETVWDEYWQLILADVKRPTHRSEVTGLAMKFLGGIYPGDDEKGVGRREICEEEGSSVECIPTMAGGEFHLSKAIQLFYTILWIHISPVDSYGTRITDLSRL